MTCPCLLIYSSPQGFTVLVSSASLSYSKSRASKLPVELENATDTITKQTSLSKRAPQLSHAAVEEPAAAGAGNGLWPETATGPILSLVSTLRPANRCYFSLVSVSEMFPPVPLLYQTRYNKVPVVYLGLSALQRNDHSIKRFGVNSWPSPGDGWILRHFQPCASP